MAQSIIRDRLLFFAVHFEGFTKNYPFLFEGLQNILKECEGLDPKIRVIALQFYSLLGPTSLVMWLQPQFGFANHFILIVFSIS